MKLSSMKFKGIRCAFYYLDSKAKVTYKQDKIDKMVKDGEDCVLMYNLSLIHISEPTRPY